MRDGGSEAITAVDESTLSDIVVCRRLDRIRQSHVQCTLFLVHAFEFLPVRVIVRWRPVKRTAAQTMSGLMDAA